MIRRTAACLGLLGFSAAIFCGLAAGNPAGTILVRAFWVMAAFVLIGSILSWVGLLVVREHVSRRHEDLFGSQKESQPSEAGENTGQADREGKEASPTGARQEAA
jgi:NO-binding membrane sensor protein with MHYT domain